MELPGRPGGFNTMFPRNGEIINLRVNGWCDGVAVRCGTRQRVSLNPKIVCAGFSGCRRDAIVALQSKRRANSSAAFAMPLLACRFPKNGDEGVASTKFFLRVLVDLA